MKNAFYISGLACAALAGCSASYPSRSSDAAYLIGANGLEFASEAQSLEDIEGQVFSVTVARFVRDRETDESVIIVSNETVNLASGFTVRAADDITLTLDGEELTFVNGRATMASGQTIWAYLNYALDHSATGAFYSYQKYVPLFEGGAIDTEGYFAIGFQTDPDELVEFTGDLKYRGEYHGFGQLIDADGGLLIEELKTNGLISITVDFDHSSVSGVLNGVFDPEGDAQTYNMFFVDAPINGNSFAAAPDMDCQPGATCTSATSLGGSFYGPGGVEISGVIGFDETTEIEETLTRFVGAAGFSTTRNPPPPEEPGVD
ncbi:transferrin-binding protein-like solute binding protein [Boseongicola aestuarii]|uniref:Transferrin binding protein-like solute binding protein n=1 Tax=Boseongicola aestuarii TaxID=1470561 RepID=A0A238J3C7_9RHOB|nr:transferrin-binding protein-like solute binding protein [Boseongicola aestuarii]SMX24470.1 Transferrin binding protein-like solute binding protein [Boseongicola aestuarii]